MQNLESINSIRFLIEKGQYKKAETISLMLINQDNYNFKAILFLSIIYDKTNRLEESIYNLKKACTVQPSCVDIYSNLVLLFRKLNRFEKAIRTYELAIYLDLKSSDLFLQIANTYIDINQPNLAVENYRQSLELNPHNSQVNMKLGIALQELGSYPESIKFLKRSIKLDPNLDIAKEALIYSEGCICDWSEFSIRQEWLSNLGIKGGSVVPTALMSIEDEPKKHLVRAKRFYESKFKVNTLKPNFIPKSKIYIGYFSADFYDHATMHLISRIFEHHDRSSFKIYAYFYGTHKEDNVTKALKKLVDVYRDVRSFNDSQLVELVRTDSIDIAVDLKGFTKDSRMSIFSYGLAPVQISYLGYPGSTGANCFDYLIADKILIPKKNQKFYSENIIYMPNSYQCNKNLTSTPKQIYRKKDFGLPEEGFIFTCFNTNFKIKPYEYDIWMRLLLRVENSVIWLFSSNKWVGINLQKEAEIRGVSKSRIILAPPMKFKDHLLRHYFADLFLDTFNYNAHTTASDSLRTGLPIVTLAGKSFSSRVCASLLYSLDLSELVTKTPSEYEELAYQLATNKKLFQLIKAKLADNIITSSLYDPNRFTRDLEEKYKNIIDKL